MENKAFAPDEDEPFNGIHEEDTHENGYLVNEDLSTEVPSSPNKQEITAIIHPEPHYVNVKTVKATDEAPQEDVVHDTEVKGDIKTTTETVLDDVTKDNVTENQGMDGNHNNTTHENGHVQRNSDHVYDNTDTTDSNQPHLQTNLGESLPNGELSPVENGNHTYDMTINAPVTAGVESQEKSHWYYFFLLLFLSGFIVALTVGLIYGRD